MLEIGVIQQTYCNETALVILCCRVYFGSAGTADLSAFINANEINWQDFIRLARMHRIRPIVFKTIGGQNIPGHVKSHIHDIQLALVKSSLRIAAETERVISLLKQHGIEAIPYKGSAYSKQFFGDLTSREISDIDLVIRPADLAKSIDILTDDGYFGELEDIYRFLGQKYFNYFKDYNFNKSAHEARKFHLELHWAITEKEIGVNPKAGWLIYDTAGEETLAKTSVIMLSPVSHFMAMLVHNTFKDNLITLKNIVDISQAMKLSQVENSAGLMVKHSVDFRIQKSLSVSNKLSQLLMGVSLPQIKSFGDADKTTNYFLQRICARQAGPANEKETMVTRVKSTASLQDSLLKKIQFYWLCLRFRFIPGRFDFRFIQLPKPLFFMYYFIKPFRTLTKSYPANEH